MNDTEHDDLFHIDYYSLIYEDKLREVHRGKESHTEEDDQGHNKMGGGESQAKPEAYKKLI